MPWSDSGGDRRTRSLSHEHSPTFCPQPGWSLRQIQGTQAIRNSIWNITTCAQGNSPHIYLPKGRAFNQMSFQRLGFIALTITGQGLTGQYYLQVTQLGTSWLFNKCFWMNKLMKGYTLIPGNTWLALIVCYSAPPPQPWPKCILYTLRTRFLLYLTPLLLVPPSWPWGSGEQKSELPVLGHTEQE